MFAPDQTPSQIPKLRQMTPFRPSFFLFLFFMKRRRLGLKVNGKAKAISFINQKLPQSPGGLSTA